MLLIGGLLIGGQTPVSAAAHPSASPATTVPARAGTADDGGGSEQVPDEVLGLVVTREPGVSAAEVESLVAQSLDAGADAVDRSPVARGVTSVQVAGGLTAGAAARAAAEVAAAPGIADVGWDVRVRPAAEVNDPRYPDQWYLQDAFGVRAPRAWSLTTGAGAVVAVVDTGSTSHPDLPGATLPGVDLISDPVVANDSDGRDSDPRDPGDWLNGQDVTDHPAQFTGCPKEPSSWHGTRVAGLIAAQQGNSQGISGLAPGSSLLPVRVMGKCGGSMADVAASITWASGGNVPGVADNPNPADVINLSLSGEGTCQPYLQSAVDGAVRRGAVVVAAAGNETKSVASSSPANCFNVISVTATTREGERAPYTNTGTPTSPVSIAAPGGRQTGNSADKLLSTTNQGQEGPGGIGYDVLAGTSMAAPLVSAAAAMVRSIHGFSPAGVAAQLARTARPFAGGGFACTVVTCGAGLLDVAEAVQNKPAPPGAPSGVQATATDRDVFLTWQPPSSSGTGPLLDYVVDYRPVGGQWVRAQDPWVNDDPLFLVEGLANGQAYDFRVAARNVYGAGPFTQTTSVTPRGMPGAVSIASARFTSKRAAKVRVRLPAGNGTPLSAVEYRLTRSTHSWPKWISVAPAPVLRLRGLRSNRSYFLQVRAVTEAGAGLAAQATVGPAFRPTAVRKVQIWRAAGRAVRITWRQPQRIGTRLRYQVRVFPDGSRVVPRWRSVQTAEYATGPLARSPYRLHVRALDGVRPGPVRTVLFRR